MSMLNDLVNQIEDKTLRDRIAAEVDRLAKQKKFGLVFEEHLPECTPLYDIPVKNGSLVMVKGGDIKELYYVKSMADGKANCVKRDGSESATFGVDDIVPVAEFGDPIYPYLKPLDSVCNAPDSDLWHTLIEADNYHALQLLEYLYAGKVDCIYIDPPYNTGARDWKYNNDYVDNSDSYRHSKWLSMMQKRLKIAKRLLNPHNSVMIVTIDEKEYLHLGCLLEEMFPEARMQMISSVINPGGAARNMQFSRTDEYIYVLEFGNMTPAQLPLSDEWAIKVDERTNRLSWRNMSRAGSNSTRQHSPGCFYPIFVSKDGSHVTGVGDALPLDMSRNDVAVPNDSIAIWPMHQDGTEGCWQLSPSKFVETLKKGYVKLGRLTKSGMAINYLNRKEIEKVETNGITVLGYNEDGSIITDDANFVRKFIPGTQWRINSHNALIGGTNLLKAIIPGQSFSYPKSLYAVEDILRFFVVDKPNALIVDFFAGSGTTLHAVNLLNAEDNGQRRCIIVTNNEVSDAESKSLTAQGYHQGDDAWERLGIARYITWPRTVCSIRGKDINGNPLEGKYLGNDLLMADGFKTNAAFFKLGFLDKNLVALGRQFKELLPILWMKAGAKNKCPELTGDTIPEMLVLPENRFAVLIDEKYYLEFITELDKHPEIKTVYIVTDSEAGFRDMISGLEDKDTYQLYRDYLDNFRINSVRR